MWRPEAKVRAEKPILARAKQWNPFCVRLSFPYMNCYNAEDCPISHYEAAESSSHITDLYEGTRNV